MAKTLVHLYFEPKMLDAIDSEVLKVGCGATRTGYIMDVLEKHLRNVKGIPYILKK